MQTVLRCGAMRATINAKGAELCSLQKDCVEYLWQADPDVWPRHAPVLFPIVGRLKNDSYAWQGATYSMGQHGFARDSTFELRSANERSATFVMHANSDTLGK